MFDLWKAKDNCTYAQIDYVSTYIKYIIFDILEVKKYVIYLILDLLKLITRYPSLLMFTLTIEHTYRLTTHKKDGG